MTAKGTADGTAVLFRLGIAGPDWADIGAFAYLTAAERADLRGRASDLAFLVANAGPSATAGPAGPLMNARRPVLDAARSHAAGQYAATVDPLKAYLRTKPTDAGGWFLLGRAHHMIGEPLLAREAYGACVALRPQHALGYYYRAQVGDEIGLVPEALADAGLAVRAAPDLLPARILLARLNVATGRPGDALKILDQMIDDGTAPTRAWFLRADVKARAGDAAGAAADLALAMTLPAADADTLAARGFARLKTDPDAALADFREAETLAPRAVAPLLNQAHIHGEKRDDPAAAVAVLDRLTARYPESALGYAGKAVYLARAGRPADAAAAAEQAVKRNPSGETLYRVGSAYARAAGTDAKYAPVALKYLAAALEKGFGHPHLPTDPDLDPVRKLPAFAALAQYVAAIAALQAPPRP